ncbi:nucleoside-diphosphate-sugar epimerase [Actinoalloteichus hoggarensis]|uniref:NAD dependent epimerase/dehydratase family protein n=1 Tax=Actinoalloteichus hoggarensis TaxID=1470176 RepID=A0A221W5J6_9PSEU|nr:NAD-dependent epimerase/dehydratase family protein [Actinoalloteichus hoggarensis]ASO20974.1 NAD dependent epimerase/dehydratase family protein [Actinoalloteichus hoggarensis]MBB5920905.1 nucleoside-diphosphate-sugar epimerase [Actinoalloteichus hoggarensis]
MFTDEIALETALSAPSAALVAEAADWPGDLVVLGAGGKMGPTLCRMARRAADEAGRTDLRVHAVSRWTDAAVADRLRAEGVEPVVFDLTLDADLTALPDAAGVVFMVGAKFGSSAAPHHAWAVNAVLPALVARRYADSAIAAFSTGNVYPLVPVAAGGCTEDDAPGPVGEYAMACLGRERVLEHAADARGTRIAVLRLNYAVEPRYGVLADVGRAVAAAEPVDVTTSHVNVVWQRYANEVALRAMTRASSPPLVLNLTGPETASTRRIALGLAERLGVPAVFTGEEAPSALLNDAGRCHALFGYPDVALGTLLDWQAEWIGSGGVLWNKPTKFQRRDGRF